MVDHPRSNSSADSSINDKFDSNLCIDIPSQSDSRHVYTKVEGSTTPQLSKRMPVVHKTCRVGAKTRGKLGKEGDRDHHTADKGQN